MRRSLKSSTTLTVACNHNTYSEIHILDTVSTLLHVFFTGEKILALIPPTHQNSKLNIMILNNFIVNNFSLMTSVYYCCFHVCEMNCHFMTLKQKENGATNISSAFFHCASSLSSSCYFIIYLTMKPYCQIKPNVIVTIRTISFIKLPLGCRLAI